MLRESNPSKMFRQPTSLSNLGYEDIKRITPEFHLGLDGKQNKYWNLEPGKTTAIEYNASGEELGRWNYECINCNDPNVKDVDFIYRWIKQ